jgi:predicted flap endonuclease-1-like 5' DNA nuclease
MGGDGEPFVVVAAETVTDAPQEALAHAELAPPSPAAGGDGQASTPLPDAPTPPPFTPLADEDDAPPAPPLSGDDLTVITGLTPALQEALYGVGVTTLDEMARWSRADARRISSLVGVPEEVIMHQWIFEAQSVLFEHYQLMMTQQG